MIVSAMEKGANENHIFLWSSSRIRQLFEKAQDFLRDHKSLRISCQVKSSFVRLQGPGNLKNCAPPGLRIIFYL